MRRRSGPTRAGGSSCQNLEPHGLDDGIELGVPLERKRVEIVIGLLPWACVEIRVECGGSALGVGVEAMPGRRVATPQRGGAEGRLIAMDLRRIAKLNQAAESK